MSILQTTIEFLGHVIEEGNVYPSEENISAVMKFPEQQNIKNIQSFLGLTSYFRKCIAGYSQIAKPLSDMLQKDKVFCFNENERIAFDNLKQILTNNPVLKLFSPDKETELHSDASKEGYDIAMILLVDSYNKQYL